MAKRTKISKFRELYPVIEDLLTTYTQEGVVEILAERHDLTLTTGTLTSYLYQHRKQLKGLSVATDNSSRNVEVEPKVRKQIFVDLKGSEPIQENDINNNDDSESDNQDDEEIDHDALLEEIKRKFANESHRSLLDR